MSSALLKSVVSAAESDRSLQLVTFSLEDELFALDILKVQEIIRLSPVTVVPHTPPYVDGVINLRGKVIPIIDLRNRLGFARCDPTPSSRIIVINNPPVILGLIVDEVYEVTHMAETDIEPASTFSGRGAEHVMGVGKIGPKLVTLLDVAVITAAR